MENASWVSVIGSLDKMLISELMLPNFKELRYSQCRRSAHPTSLLIDLMAISRLTGILVNSLTLVGTSLVFSELTEANYCNHCWCTYKESSVGDVLGLIHNLVLKIFTLQTYEHCSSLQNFETQPCTNFSLQRDRKSQRNQYPTLLLKGSWTKGQT